MIKIKLNSRLTVFGESVVGFGREQEIVYEENYMHFRKSILHIAQQHRNAPFSEYVSNAYAEDQEWWALRE